ncbi:MAG TPA: carboxypeptidase regulatory-like domain-containing protein, partial [Burkholderiales bacterium]|nr:carboxypeptidase regulatory-like domain-containing protein [Burkholderiales bacterium]
MNGRRWAHLRRLALCWLCAFGLLHGAAASAQGLAPEVSRGLAWLQGQVRADGSLANEGSSVATGLQSRAEAAQTFKLLSAIPVSLTDAIAGETDDNTEYLARGIVSLALAGRDPSTLLAALAARQNSDGGFGGGPGFDSNALDTAWALIALRSSASLGVVPQALGYLGLAQAFDGSYSAPGRPDIEATAVAVLALGLYASQFDSFAAIARAVPYLLSQQSPGQQWGSSAFLTATAYAAIHDFVPLEPTATAVRGFLTARQGPEGSWDGGDPFSTALALRALMLSATAPANPTLGIVRGRVIDSQTRLSLDGVSVTLSGPSNPVPALTSAGSFEFRDIFPGTYTLQLSLNQYGVITFSTTLRPGQTVDFGAIALTKNGQATTGTVRGTVSDASTGLPVAGATVSLSSGQAATTDATGSYQISNITPANVIAVANKTGYASAPGSGAVVAGGTMIFSPSLVPATQSAGAAIEGVVTDAITHAPLQGAAITVTGSTQAGATTDVQGHYRIAPLNPGVITVSVVRAGYRSATSTVTVDPNATLQYSPGLQVPDNGRAKLFVVSNQGEGSTNQVFRYELTGPSSTPVLAFTLTHPSFDHPCCVAFNDTGDVLVVNRGNPTPGNGSVSRFSDAAGTPTFKDTFTAPTFSGPILATFRRGELFIAQRFGNDVLRFKFDAAGNVTSNGIITAGLGNTAPRGVIANPATGELFVTQCCGIDSINRYVFDANGNAVPNGVITGGGLNNPHDMAFSARGELFVANVNGNSVSRFLFDAAGNAFPNGQIVGNGLSGPLGLDFSPWGELFVANFLGSGGVARWLFDASFNAIPNGFFSTPVTLGDLQFLPSVPGVRGLVVDAANEQPLAGVTVQAIIGNSSRQLTTGPDGRFEIDGLPAGQAQVSFGLTGYLTQNFALQLSTLTDIDIGAVRLRKSDSGTLLPDLVVRSVDTQQV